MAPSKRTSTSNFGVGSREGHDASAFYARFAPPLLSSEDQVGEPFEVAEPFQVGDARDMSSVPDNSVALVVTSPPYFAGKQYEEELERDGVPSTYLEYLQLLHEVFRECVRTLEPGGRIAVNVANLGRKPYRSLSADVTQILQDLGLLLRGEVIWQKGEGANGSCAWGSFRSATNPVLRDITERVIIASKGRFDRAKSVRQRQALGLPYESTVMTDDFLALTLDVWSIPPESARRVGHPAPFPVELPEQLIRLYTFKNDLVLDPFMGSGSTMVAAAQLDRRYVGFDLDPEYVAIARERVASEGSTQVRGDATERGVSAQKLAEQVVDEAGFSIVASNRRFSEAGVTVSIVAEDRAGSEWYFDVSGAFTSHRGGLQRSDAVWKALGRANALIGALGSNTASRIPNIVLLASHVPKPRSEGDRALRAAGRRAFFDVIGMLGDDGRQRLARYAAADFGSAPLPGFWTKDELLG